MPATNMICIQSLHLLALFGPKVGLGQHDLFGAVGDTSLHPAILAAMAVVIVLMFVLPREQVVLPLLFLSIATPMAQKLMVGSFHFQMFRVLLLFAWIRLLWQRYGREGRASEITLNSIDKAVILYTVSSTICYTILWQDSAAFFDQIGKGYNVLGFYFVFRFFVRSQKDIERVIKTLAVTAFVIAGVMLNEQLTGRNVLAVFGGVPEFTAIREGYLRSQGPFSVYLTAGAFGATAFPLFLNLWHKGGSRIFAALGMTAAITIAVTSRTSTAISAFLGTLLGLGMWALRDKMSLVRRGLVLMLVGLHLVMKAPVWSLIARVDIVGGSTGWHRYKIIDNFIHHFWDWWLFGSNNYWTWDGGDDMWDLANQYVATGESTGLLSLIFFIAAIVFAFKYLGKARRGVGRDTRQGWFLWLLGVALFSNLIGFLGISYFDQTFIYWYALLAMIVTAAHLRHSGAKVKAVESSRTRMEFWQAAPDAHEPAIGRSLFE